MQDPIPQLPGAPVFSPPDGLALWIPLPADPGMACMRLGCEHSVRVGFLALSVPKGFPTDGASIPRPLEWVFPRRLINHIHRAGASHDYLYLVQCCSRWQADAVFRDIMEADGVPRFWALICWLAVRAFGWRVWRRYSEDAVLRENRKKYAFDPNTEGIQKPE